MYRTSPCAFCDQVAAATCARCRAPTCGDHRGQSRDWCTVCEHERRELIAVAEAGASFAGPAMREERSILYPAYEPTRSINLFRLLQRRFGGPVRAWRARKAAMREFMDASPEAIAQARRKPR